MTGQQSDNSGGDRWPTAPDASNTGTLVAKGGARWHTSEMEAQPRAIGESGPIIRVQVRELQGKELGALDSPNFSEYVRKAEERKSQEDKASYGKTTRELEQDARESGYYGSPAHLTWAFAAEERTGGRLNAAWWMKFDPYGGTAGNGPNILPEGQYPGVLSKIAMGHDTDWSLGRHFQAGPLRGLYGDGHDAETRGKYGLDPLSPIKPGVDIYTNGHPDWKVTYRDETKKASLDSDSPSQNIALAPGNDSVNRQFAQALKGANGDRDAAAVAVNAIREAGGKPDQDISVVQGKNGLIVSQGQGDAALNVPVPQAKAGDFERISAHLAQQPSTAQQGVAAPTEQQERKQPTV